MMLGPCTDHGLRGDAAGYGQRRTGGKSALVHRLAYAAHHGLDEATMGGVVMHGCDNPRCINPAHLQLGTYKENAADRDTKGRANTPIGERHGMAVLSAEDVVSIRAEYIPRDKECGGAALPENMAFAKQLCPR